MPAPLHLNAALLEGDSGADFPDSASLRLIVSAMILASLSVASDSSSRVWNMGDLSFEENDKDQCTFSGWGLRAGSSAGGLPRVSVGPPSTIFGVIASLTLSSAFSRVVNAAPSAKSVP